MKPTCWARARYIYMFLLLLLPVQVAAKKHVLGDSLVMRALQYGLDSSLTSFDSIDINVYEIGSVTLRRRNFALISVPSMFYVMNDSMRTCLWERYGTLSFRGSRKYTSTSQLLLSTVRNHKRVMPNASEYALPFFYHPNLFKNGVLSPLCIDNKKYYRYQSQELTDTTALITIRGKISSTQLVRNGRCIIDSRTGQLMEFQLEIEFDMFHFTLSGQMDERGKMPCKSHITGQFTYLGNKVISDFRVHYGLPTTLPDSLKSEADPVLMERLRPEPLDSVQKAVVDEYILRHPQLFAENADSLSAPPEKKSKGSKFWDFVEDNLISRINTRLTDRGNISFAPLFNPLYFGYSKHKGIVYKFAMRGSWRLNDNSSLDLNAKAGYSFKQNQLYYQIPFTYTINRRRNASVFASVANGNRITNSSVLKEVKETHRADSINWDKMGLTYFHDLSFTLGTNYGILQRYLDLQIGATIHWRKAVREEGFEIADRPTKYRSFAPYMQLSYWPLGRNYPWAATMQYEHGVRTLGGRLTYQKLEVDTQYKLVLTRLRTLSLRLGGGGFLNRYGSDYFVDYYNFRQENIPGGWNDDWSGDFELLNSNWYNASDYYVRCNATYESPLLLLSWIPWVGRAMELERIYFSVVSLTKLHPYAEVGYGFTNRLFSLGVFVGGSPYRFEGVGLRLGLELFEKW